MFHAKASTRQGKANKDLKPRKQAKQTKLSKIDGRLLMFFNTFIVGVIFCDND